MTRTLPKKIKAVYWNQEWAGNATSFEKTFDDLTTGDDGYNVIILAFWTHEDADMAKDWANVVKDDPDGAQRAKQVLINNNAFLFLSMGGATYLPIDGAKGCTFNYPSTADLVRFKNTLYDGVDYDMEHICRMDCTVKAGCNADCTKSPSDGPCITAMVKSMKGARDEGLFVAAAPQGPYFSDNQYSINYASPALLNVIDFYNIQFYNNDPGEGVAAGCSFSDNESWLMSDTASLNPWGAANVQWVIDAGVPASKIVIGKCNQGCPNGGYVGGGTLLNWIEKFNSTPGGASNKEEIRGIMVWELNNTKGVTSTTGDWEAGKDVDCGMACAGRGWLTDKTDNCEGKPVGALLPAAGQKGYGLGLIAELLAYAILGPVSHPNGLGLNSVVIAVDTSKFTGAAALTERADEILRELRAVTPAPGFEHQAGVEIPGQRENNRSARILKAGGAMPIAAGIWSEIASLAEESGVQAVGMPRVLHKL